MLTVIPLVGDGANGIVPSGVLQRIMCHSIVTRRWRERRTGEVAEGAGRCQVAAPVLERRLGLLYGLLELFECGGVTGEAVCTPCGPVTRRAAQARTHAVLALDGGHRGRTCGCHSLQVQSALVGARALVHAEFQCQLHLKHTLLLMRTAQSVPVTKVPIVESGRI